MPSEEDSILTFVGGHMRPTAQRHLIRELLAMICREFNSRSLSLCAQRRLVASCTSPVAVVSRWCGHEPSGQDGSCRNPIVPLLFVARVARLRKQASLFSAHDLAGALNDVKASMHAEGCVAMRTASTATAVPVCIFSGQRYELGVLQQFAGVGVTPLGHGSHPNFVLKNVALRRYV